MVYLCGNQAEVPWTISKYPITTVADAPIPQTSGQSLQLSDTVLATSATLTAPYRILRIGRGSGDRMYVKLSCIVVSTDAAGAPDQNQVVEVQFLALPSSVQYFGFVTLTDSLVFVEVHDEYVDIFLRRPAAGAPSLFYNAYIDVRPLVQNMEHIHVCFEEDGRTVRWVASI